MREAGVTSVWITSTYRDASDQARAMVQNIEKHGAASQKTLYRGKPGAELVDLYVREQAALDDAASRGIDTGVKSAFARQRHLMRVLEQKIEDMGADKISRHSGLQAILNVFDVAPSSMTPDKRPAFLKAARSDPRVSRIIPPPKDPAFHFEIAQVGDFEVSSLAKTTA
jgi:hypothetical protein